MIATRMLSAEVVGSEGESGWRENLPLYAGRVSAGVYRNVFTDIAEADHRGCVACDVAEGTLSRLLVWRREERPVASTAERARIVDE
jgi:hypothetical protein